MVRRALGQRRVELAQGRQEIDDESRLHQRRPTPRIGLRRPRRIAGQGRDQRFGGGAEIHRAFGIPRHGGAAGQQVATGAEGWPGIPGDDALDQFGRPRRRQPADGFDQGRIVAQAVFAGGGEIGQKSVDARGVPQPVQEGQHPGLRTLDIGSPVAPLPWPGAQHVPGQLVRFAPQGRFGTCAALDPALGQFAQIGQGSGQGPPG